MTYKLIFILRNSLRLILIFLFILFLALKHSKTVLTLSFHGQVLLGLIDLIYIDGKLFRLCLNLHILITNFMFLKLLVNILSNFLFHLFNDIIVCVAVINQFDNVIVQFDELFFWTCCLLKFLLRFLILFWRLLYNRNISILL